MTGPRSTRSSTMHRFHELRRSATNHFVTGLAIFSTVLVLVPLVAILGYLIYKGASSLNLAFFTHVPAPVGEPGGGMANAIARLLVWAVTRGESAGHA